MAIPDYILGDGERELRRLQHQGRMVEHASRRLLNDVGVGPGVDLLDVGTGRGDLAIMAAEISGGTGRIVGIDRSSNAIEQAKARVTREGHDVTFLVSDLDGLRWDGQFDHVIGRYVLAHQADQVAFVRKAASYVRPGGKIAFLDVDTDENGPIYAVPPLPLLHDAVSAAGRLWAALGTRMNPGSRYRQLFFEAGLSEPTVIWEHMRPRGNADIIEWLCGILQTIRPALTKMDPDMVARLELDTLDQRLLAAAAEAHSQISPPRLAGGWVVVP